MQGHILAQGQLMEDTADNRLFRGIQLDTLEGRVCPPSTCDHLPAYHSGCRAA
jgi:hypothetical protein